MQTLIRIAAALAVAAAAPPAHAAAAQAPAGSEDKNCFVSGTWNGWSAIDDGDALLLRVGQRDFYRVELTAGTHAQKRPGEFLVNEVRGSIWVCSNLDLDLVIADRVGVRRPLIATSLRKLTPEEVAAIPKDDLP
jgi:hypothetical protein